MSRGFPRVSLSAVACRSSVLSLFPGFLAGSQCSEIVLHQDCFSVHCMGNLSTRSRGQVLCGSNIDEFGICHPQDSSQCRPCIQNLSVCLQESSSLLSSFLCRPYLPVASESFHTAPSCQALTERYSESFQ